MTPDSETHFAALDAAVAEKDWLAAQEALVPLLEQLPAAQNVIRAASLLRMHLDLFEEYRPNVRSVRQIVTALADGKPIPADTDDPAPVQGTNPIPVLFSEAVERLEMAAESTANPHVCAVNCARVIGAAVQINRYRSLLVTQPREWVAMLKHQGKLHREIAEDLARQSADAQNRSEQDYAALIAELRAGLQQS